MILRIEDLKDMSKKILAALETSEITQITSTLQLTTEGNYFCMGVCGSDYYVRTKFDMREHEEFDAAVKADTFLKLVASTTTDTMELSVKDGCLIVSGNGNYKLPMIYTSEGELFQLPQVSINNKTAEFDIEGDVLASIDIYNSREVEKKFLGQEVNKRYYIDENGAITFTNCACVNNFTLPSPIKLLFTPKLVKLLRLFKNSTVHFTLGHDMVSDDGKIDTKVKFENDLVTAVFILPTDTDDIISNVPVQPIRNRVNNLYPYCVSLNRDALLQTINRLALFIDKSRKALGQFVFSPTSAVLSDFYNPDNNEILYYENDDTGLSSDYSCKVDIMELKSTLEGSNDMHVTIKFGDGQAFVISKDNIHNVIPEITKV